MDYFVILYTYGSLLGHHLIFLDGDRAAPRPTCLPDALRVVLA